MSLSVRARRLVAATLLLAVSAAMPCAAFGEADSLVIVEPDVELVWSADGVAALPSAERSEAVARRWPGAAAAALDLGDAAHAWRPPEEPRDLVRDDALALQDAVALALLEDDDPPRALSIGPGAARLAAASGATHGLFAQVRGTSRRGRAVAMLVDLRSGLVLRHRVVDGFAPDTAPDRLTARLAADLLGDWRGAVPRLASIPPAPGLADDAAQDDVARAAVRLERRLRRHPRRVDDPALAEALRSVACRVDADQCAMLRPIVLAEPEAHAAILPGGALVVHTGLLLRLEDEAELAFVLAHEFAHERHGDVRARLAEARDGGRGDASRARETAADRDAFARLVAAGYDPASAVNLWSRLAAEQASAGAATMPGSHPSAAERLAAARAAAAGAARGDDGRERWATLVAPRRARWLADEIERGDPATTIAWLESLLGRPDAAIDTDAHAEWTRALAAARRHADGHPASGTPGSTMPVRPPPSATPAAAEPSSPPRMLRVLGLRLRSRLDWRQRPGIGAVAWTVDGTPLNRLLIVSRVRRGEPLLRDASAAPRWPGATPAATTALIAAALRGAGWTGVRTEAERPHDFGGHAGRRAEISLADAGGLDYRGTLAHVVRDGRLTWIVWMAPEGFYHDRDAAEVAAMLDGMRFAR